MSHQHGENGVLGGGVKFKNCRLGKLLKSSIICGNLNIRIRRAHLTHTRSEC